MINNNSFNIELLYVFVKVCELKSINKSSGSLLMTQPAISKKIKQLETYYGKQLFIRSSQGMELTSVGHKLYIEAQHFINKFEQITYLISENTIQISDIKVGSLDSISSYMYPSFFANFLSDLKQVVITNRIFDLIQPFNEKRLDLILIDSEFKEDFTGDVKEIRLFSEPYYLVYSQDNTIMKNLFDTSTVNAADLAYLKIIMYPKYCPIHQKIIQIYQQLKIPLPKIIEIDYSESTIAMISNSDYVTILPMSIALNKVTQNIGTLTMTQLDDNFTRHVSLFAHNTEILHLVHNRLN
ncbi:transcriptional regulator [Leuconostoc litchii]|uniref:LysR family transcriptional regulator n=1 Tax=Leuconostoc litchii TaxID=1981069 RepID=A0A6P2CLM2_9LACO|nr:LysR family transcriptional regulator [Leuconostoc litchii]TYC46347.1 LysR family transcriptional regulator [Leuconostoc litchii]GMA70076.1 transcriptional regulator [Leuconostoc litchii]